MLDLDEDPLPDNWNRWGVGCLGAVAASSTAAIISTRHVIHLPGRRGGIRLEGTDVTAAAFIMIALAVFLHVHFFWSGSERLIFVRELLRMFAIGAGLIAFGMILVHQARIF